MRRAWVLSFALGLLVTLSMVVVSGRDTPFLVRTQDTVHDAFLRASPRAYDPNTPVHIIDIDEASLRAYGQWPWPRTYLATLTEKLFRYGAVVVGFDILFPEADRTAFEGGQRLVEDSMAALLPPGAPPDTHDRWFAKALSSGPTVLGVAGATEGTVPKTMAGISYSGDPPGRILTQFPAALTNIEILDASASGIGAVSLDQMSDGIVRSVPAVTDIGGKLVPAFGLELLRVAQGAGGYILKTTQASGEVAAGATGAVAIRVGALEVPLRADGHVQLHFSGRNPARTTSAARVLQTNGVDPELARAIEGRIILVGASAQALFDIRATPLETHVPGVEIHAELIEQIVAGDYVYRPDWARGAEVLAIILAGLFLTLALMAERPVLALGTAVLLSCASYAGSAWAFTTQGLLLNPLFPILTSVLIFLPGAAIGYFLKERARAAVRSRFSYFLPSDLVDEIADDPAKILTPTGADRELTILFADMRGFTTATEKMPPSDVVRYVNAFLSTVSDALTAHGATIDKFMGDAVMAFWNAPVETGDHRGAALRSIAEVEDAIRQRNKTLPDEGLPSIDVALGVNTGLASVGLMGSKDRLSYTCIGDSVTLAARLEGLTRRYGVGNCVSSETLEQVPDGLIAVELDLIAVKGRAAEEPVLTVLDDTDAARDFAAKLSDARNKFRTRDWDGAAEAFGALSAVELHGRSIAPLVTEYLGRISDYRQNPPPQDWAGGFKATEKR